MSRSDAAAPSKATHSTAALSTAGSAAATAPAAVARSRRTAAYRLLRRLHLAIALVAAVPLVVTSLTGALLVFGHELEALVRPPVVIAASAAAVAAGPLTHAALLERVAAQRPEARVWTIVTHAGDDAPRRLWLAGGAGVLEVDPYSGAILDAYRPADTPYNIVRALHRRWLVDGRPQSDWTRTIISVSSLALMIQAVVGLWLWALPSRRLQRLRPAFGGNWRLLVHRLHTTSGVVTALILLAVAFTGLSMYWVETTRALVDAVLPGAVETPAEPAAAGLAPVADLDAAVAVARRRVPDGAVASVRPPGEPGKPVHVSFRIPGTGVHSRVWVGDDPPRVVQFYDGGAASAATRFWQFRYWLHVGDFAGWPIRVLWLIASLMPLAFVASGYWLWRDRRRPRRRRGGSSR